MSSEDLRISIKRLAGNADIPLPEYQSEGAVGMDVHAAVKSEMLIKPGEIVSIPCGFALAVPAGYEAQIRPRSGLSAQHGITIPNSPGTIDPDYRGEVKILLVNLGSEPFIVRRSMRIAQMLILPVPRVRWIEVNELPATARAEGGFGHTGT